MKPAQVPLRSNFLLSVSIMKVKEFIKRLNELASMANGDETEVILCVASTEDEPGELFDRCRPELVEVRKVIDLDFMVQQHYRAAENNDLDRDLVKAITIGNATIRPR
jgi:hypothetical protein